MNNQAPLMRYEAATAAQTREMLAEYPHLQAEAIARHYAGYATIAMQILKLLRVLETSRYKDDCAELKALIKAQVDKIKAAHREDLGLELEWPKEDRIKV